jgi:hypothetical protein
MMSWYVWSQDGLVVSKVSVGNRNECSEQGVM